MDRVELDLWKPRDVSRLLSLVEAERRYFQDLMALLPVGVALVSPSLSLTLTNRAFRRMLGIDRDAAADRKLDELLDMKSLQERVRETISSRQATSVLNPATPTPRGARSLLVNLQLFREWDDEGVPEVLVTLEDVTDMVGASAARAIEAAEPATLPAAAPSVSPTKPLSPTAAAALIMSRLQPAAPPPAVPVTAAPAAAPAPAPPATIEAVLAAAPAITWRIDPATLAFAKVHWPAELADTALPKDAWRAGADFWTGRVVAAHLPLVKSFYDQLLSGAPLHTVEYRAVTTSGRSLWLRDTARVVHDADGKPLAIEGATAEVSHFRQREDSITQAHKIDALTRLAGRVAHECNNLLTILGGHGEELLHSLSPDNPLRANAQEILTAGDRLNTFTRQLSSFVKHPSPEPSAIAVDALINDYREELRHLLPSSVRLIINTGAPQAVATGDPALLVHALRTFTLRGAEAMRGEGTLSIDTTSTVAADPTAASRAALPPGRYLQISIRDTGHAIHPDLLQQIFEPPMAEETPRHNLAAIYKSVREMGGDLTVTSEFDRGTNFTLLLPRHHDAAAAPAAVSAPAWAEPAAAVDAPEAPAVPAEPAAAAPAAPRVETILVVEDEAGIRGLIRRILARQSYEILEASNGRQALELARAHAGKIDMLLTDVVMPEMGGFDLANELIKERPDVRVLFISGYTGLSGFDPTQLPAGSGFLQKPFTLNALLAKVRDVFAQKLEAR
ncbi:MAG: response regulator [Bryobacterales bacterium]|nr:response regulator [Bryobacterales bacterium]